MRYLALATDYDGTLATHGRVTPETIAAMEKLRASGRRLLLVTGRELPDLGTVFDRLDLFDIVVAENGALLYTPSTRDEEPIAERPPPEFAARLRERGVTPLSEGRVIVATWEPHETVVLDTIRELGLELQVIFNKGAVMILPSGVNKATGLRAALARIGVSLRNTVAVGDAENDHAFLRVCEVSAAVSNALPSLLSEVDLVTTADHGAGVAELAEAMVANDLGSLAASERRTIEVGLDRANALVSVDPAERGILVAGQSGSGKSTAAIALLERFREKGYQYCLLDPEGDHEAVIDGVSCLGSTKHAPSVEEVVGLASAHDASVAVNLLGLPMDDRPGFLGQLIPHLVALRAKSGAPHWIVVDEAHHMLGHDRPAEISLATIGGVVLVTVHPKHVARPVLDCLDVVIAVGKEEAARATVVEFCGAAGLTVPTFDPLEEGEVFVFRRGEAKARAVKITPSRAQHLRHRRKYAQGELGEDKSFFFTGPDNKLNLRAQNLFLFLQIGEGVDDETWSFHLKRGDYESWFRSDIKDPELADEAHTLAEDETLDAGASRRKLRELVEARYTAPA